MRPLTFAEMERVSGGYWHSYSYTSSSGETHWDREWIDDYPSNTGVSGDAGSDLAMFDYEQSAPTAGITLDNFQHYEDTAVSVVSALESAVQASDDRGHTYSSNGDVFGTGDGLSGYSWLGYALANDVPRDAVVFGDPYSGNNYTNLTRQDIQSLGMYRQGQDSYGANLNGIPINIQYHGVEPGQQSSIGDEVQVDGSYYTISFLGLDPITLSSLGLDQAYSPPSNNPGDVGDRHDIYVKMDDAINGSSSHYHTHFFAAAADVTGLTGLELAEEVSRYNPGDFPYSMPSVNALEQIGGSLYKYINAPAFNALYNGKDDFVLHVERTGGSFVGLRLGDIAKYGENAIDVAMVMNEQYNVQIALAKLAPDVRSNLVTESNTALASFSTQAVTMAEQRLGHAVNFASINDRIELGYDEVRVASH